VTTERPRFDRPWARRLCKVRNPAQARRMTGLSRMYAQASEPSQRAFGLYRLQPQPQQKRLSLRDCFGKETHATPVKWMKTPSAYPDLLRLQPVLGDFLQGDRCSTTAITWRGVLQAPLSACHQSHFKVAHPGTQHFNKAMSFRNAHSTDSLLWKSVMMLMLPVHAS
jgi:hypothetical protein